MSIPRRPLLLLDCGLTAPPDVRIPRSRNAHRREVSWWVTQPALQPEACPWWRGHGPRHARRRRYRLGI